MTIVCRAHAYTAGVCPVCETQRKADELLARKDEEIEQLRGTIETYRRELGII